MHYMLNRKATIALLIVAFTKRHTINEWIFFKTEMSRGESES